MELITFVFLLSQLFDSISFCIYLALISDIVENSIILKLQTLGQCYGSPSTRATNINNLKYITWMFSYNFFCRSFWWGKSRDLMLVSFMQWRYWRRQLWKVRHKIDIIVIDFQPKLFECIWICIYYSSIKQSLTLLYYILDLIKKM